MILRLLIVFGAGIALVAIVLTQDGGLIPCWSQGDPNAAASWSLALSRSSVAGALAACISKWTLIAVGFLIPLWLAFAALAGKDLVALFWSIYSSAYLWFGAGDKPIDETALALLGALVVLVFSSVTAWVIVRNKTMEAVTNPGAALAFLCAGLWEFFVRLFGALMVISLLVWGFTAKTAPATDASVSTTATAAIAAGSHRAPTPDADSSVSAPARTENQPSGHIRSNPPVLLKQVRIRVPDTARQTGVSGDVRLLAEIGASGAVTAVEVDRGLDPRVDDAARQAVSRWRFEPAMMNGEAVAARARITIELRAGQAFGELVAISFAPASANLGP